MNIVSCTWINPQQLVISECTFIILDKEIFDKTRDEIGIRDALYRTETHFGHLQKP